LNLTAEMSLFLRILFLGLVSQAFGWSVAFAPGSRGSLVLTRLRLSTIRTSIRSNRSRPSIMDMQSNLEVSPTSVDRKTFLTGIMLGFSLAPQISLADSTGKFSSKVKANPKGAVYRMSYRVSLDDPMSCESDSFASQRTAKNRYVPRILKVICLQGNLAPLR
jgi:hypothetical protein